MRACDLPVTALRDPHLFSGVVALESAGYFHGLNMYGITPVVLMSDTPTEIYTQYIRHVPFVFNTREGLTHLGGKLYVTTPERTICELVMADGNDEFILQSLESYLAKYGTEKAVMDYADKYGCSEQMRRRLDEIKECQ